MDNKTMIVVVVVVAVIVIAAIAFIVSRRRNSEHLRSQFGPEYDRALKQHGDASKAEADLHAREKHVHSLSIRPLSPADHDRYAADWHEVQRHFADDPSGAVAQADTLVTAVMNARGYPMGEFDQRAADISVNYPSVVQNYRTARQITQLNSQGKATTEDLRRAMVHFRSLFDELIDALQPESAGVRNA